MDTGRFRKIPIVSAHNFIVALPHAWDRVPVRSKPLIGASLKAGLTRCFRERGQVPDRFLSRRLTQH